jgi:epoxyqueuosine reductase QueG
MTKKQLSKTLKEMALDLGAHYVGISTLETLKNGPPSTNLNTALNTAKSVITFAVPFNQKLIKSFLSKET